MKDYGVADLDVFQTVDLYNKKDISQVTTTLFALGRTVSTQQTRNTINRSWSFPKDSSLSMNTRHSFKVFPPFLMLRQFKLNITNIEIP